MLALLLGRELTHFGELSAPGRGGESARLVHIAPDWR